MSSSSSIPFSWETHPGMPKHRKPHSPTPSQTTVLALPLPPNFRSKPSKKLPSKQQGTPSLSEDPFSIALMECSREEREEEEEEVAVVVVSSSPSWKRAVREWISRRPLDLLYCSCRSRPSVIHSTVSTANMVSSYGPLLRRRVG